MDTDTNIQDFDLDYHNEFIRAYVEHPGDYSPEIALSIAVQRDEEAAEQLYQDVLMALD